MSRSNQGQDAYFRHKMSELIRFSGLRFDLDLHIKVIFRPETCKNSKSFKSFFSRTVSATGE
jgi:hypothetical protein